MAITITKPITGRKQGATFHRADSIITSMATRDEALAALSKNEPVDWLLGRVLRSFSDRGKWHRLFDILAGKNPHELGKWNAWIEEFRRVLQNPDTAAAKADAELSASEPDRIADFMSEVFTVIRLSRSGYSGFEVVLAPGNKAAVDFTAVNAGRRVRIEVKHLLEPQDIIRTIVKKQWDLCRNENRDQFNFAMRVSHHHHGTVSDAAISRSKNAIDVLPNLSTDKYSVTLDGGAGDVVLTRGERGVNPGALAIESGYGSEDFEFDLPELQGVYS